jgi:hypothetical protein
MPEAPQLGVLAIWHDCRAGREADLEAWFQGEHLIERMAVPGFRYGRRHKAVSGTSGYFNFYVVDGPDILVSRPYLERLDNPTPMTKVIMSEVFLNMSRTLCTRTLRRGAFRGAYAVTACFNGPPDMAALTAQIETLTRDTRIAAGEIWSALDPAGQPVSTEEKLRGGDKKIDTALMVDTLYEDDAEETAEWLARAFPAAEIGVFRVLSQIGRGDL